MQAVDTNFFTAISDTWEITKRNLLRYRRTPRLVFFSLVQPVMFVLLFAYVFGGAINVPGGSYINYLIPAIIIQTVLFGSGQTAVGLAEDMHKGLIDRFRSLPMSSAAVIAGRTLADSIRNIFVIGIMIGVGYLIGFRIQTDFWQAIAAVGLALLFGFAIMWIMTTIGLIAKDAETAQLATFVTMFPLTFASSAFVPTATLPTVLRVFAEHSPVTFAINSIRGLMVTSQTADVNNLFMWIVGILVVFFPLGVRMYRKVT